MIVGKIGFAECPLCGLVLCTVHLLQCSFMLFNRGFKFMLCEFCCSVGFMQTGMVRRRKWSLGLCCESEWFCIWLTAHQGCNNSWYIWVVFLYCDKHCIVSLEMTLSAPVTKTCSTWKDKKPDTSCICCSYSYWVTQLYHIYSPHTHILTKTFLYRF